MPPRKIGCWADTAMAASATIATAARPFISLILQRRVLLDPASEDAIAHDLPRLCSDPPVRLLPFDAVVPFDRPQRSQRTGQLNSRTEAGISAGGVAVPRVAHERQIREAVEAHALLSHARHAARDDGAVVANAGGWIPVEAIIETVEAEEAESIEVMA